MGKQVIVVLLMLFCGCAIHGIYYVKEVSEEEEGKSKTLSPPAGKALLYVIRPSHLAGSGVPDAVIINEILIGHLSPKNYLPIILEPGRHRMRYITYDGALTEISGTRVGYDRRSYVRVYGGWELFNYFGMSNVFFDPHSQRRVVVHLMLPWARSSFTSEELWRYGFDFDVQADSTYFIAGMDGDPTRFLKQDEGRDYIEGYRRSAEQFNASKWSRIDNGSVEAQGYDLTDGIVETIPALNCLTLDKDSEADKAPCVLKRVSALYPKRAYEAKVEGLVSVKVLVDTNGTPQQAVVVKSSSSEFDLAATKAALEYRLTPARKAGRPTEAWAIISVDFKLENIHK